MTTTTTYTISDSNSSDSELDYDAAVERIADWYRDSDEWSDGERDADAHERIADAIESVDEPPADGDADDLQAYANAICTAIAEAMGYSAFAGHGRYEVSAADRGGYNLSVVEHHHHAD